MRAPKCGECSKIILESDGWWDHTLTCKQLVELVTDYLERSLSEQDRLRFEAHLEGCDGCRNYLQQIRRTIDLLGRLIEDSLHEDAKNDLLEVFWDWRKN